jgi:hypothetical protein
LVRTTDIAVLVVPITWFGNVSVSGESVRVGGVTVSVALTVLFSVAEMMTGVCVVTAVVVTVKVPLVVLAAIGTLDDTSEATEGVPLVSWTTVGVSGAELSVTVPVMGCPP